ncbi:ABC transporter substrate-binding protein [Mesorhizobium sp.]|uniref:ABC transporter substrate-binding protein n=1 Tax=Mesorhizobium sp. TaxID=1871066 RepID=UPI000FE4B9D7|nr:ABC transporter substrate-binding protein [Mesorhizobium sp.]RWB51542.1 MAG: ABC transporter substrate-binding protein [Mesorhizobium sp.]
MNASSLVQRLAVNAQVKRLGVGAQRVVKVGFLGPLSGPVRSWGLPGLNGCRIWVDWINRTGGMLIGGTRHNVQLLAEDCGYVPDRAAEGARRLVQDHGVGLLMMHGGDTFRPIQDYLMSRKILTSTLLPSDLSPDTPYLIAPSEIHPLYNVTAVEWLARNRPDLRRVAMCSQTDALGLPSLATYRAAFAAEGIASVGEIRYAPEATNADEILRAMLVGNPDILCWCTSYEPMVHALTEAAFRSGFRGQIISCTADYYRRLVDRTSIDFMEGFLFQFPDFDDPELRDKAFFFNRPAEFYAEYNRRFPDSWSAVSWEYVATLDLWHAAVEKAGTAAPVSVLAAMKHGGLGEHAFGIAKWAGSDLFGNDNALIGDWPVVRITNGQARIVAFGSVPAWLQRHGARLRDEMRALGLMWDQRHSSVSGELSIAVGSD